MKEGLKMYQKEVTTSKMEANIQTESVKKVMSTQGKGLNLTDSENYGNRVLFLRPILTLDDLSHM